MKVIKRVEALEAKGHYALAVAEGGRVYVSGQFSVDPKTGEKKFGSVEEEVAQRERGKQHRGLLREGRDRL